MSKQHRHHSECTPPPPMSSEQADMTHMFGNAVMAEDMAHYSSECDISEMEPILNSVARAHESRSDQVTPASQSDEESNGFADMVHDRYRRVDQGRRGSNLLFNPNNLSDSPEFDSTPELPFDHFAMNNVFGTLNGVESVHSGAEAFFHSESSVERAAGGVGAVNGLNNIWRNVNALRGGQNGPNRCGGYLDILEGTLNGTSNLLAMGETGVGTNDGEALLDYLRNVSSVMGGIGSITGNGSVEILSEVFNLSVRGTQEADSKVEDTGFFSDEQDNPLGLTGAIAKWADDIRDQHGNVAGFVALQAGIGWGALATPFTPLLSLLPQEGTQEDSSSTVVPNWDLPASPVLPRFYEEEKAMQQRRGIPNWMNLSQGHEYERLLANDPEIAAEYARGIRARIGGVRGPNGDLP